MHLEADRLAVMSDGDREQVERLLFQFDSFWSPDLLAKAVHSIPEGLAEVHGAILEELVKIDIERRWNSGDGRPLEDYLREFRDLGTNETVSASLIRVEYGVRKRGDNPVSAREIRKRFPAQFDDLRRLMRESAQAQSLNGSSG